MHPRTKVKNAAIQPLTQYYLRSILKIDEENGGLIWRVNRHKARLGAVAGSHNRRSGYRDICINYKNYLVHRIVWIIANGPIPDGMQIDHINGIRSDNRLSNLRLADQKIQKANYARQKRNKTGHRGVLPTPEGRYRAQIGHKRKLLHIGIFDKVEDAAAAYRAKALELWGDAYRDEGFRAS